MRLEEALEDVLEAKSSAGFIVREEKVDVHAKYGLVFHDVTGYTLQYTDPQPRGGIEIYFRLDTIDTVTGHLDNWEPYL